MLTSVIQLYKEAYTALSRNSWYLSAVMLVNRSGTMVVAFMSVYCVRELHFSILQASIIMMLFGAGSMCGAFIGGKLTDKIGFYDLQVAAQLSGGALFILLGYQHTFLTVASGAFILSLCNESVRPANSAAIAHYSDENNKTRSFSLSRLAVNLGWAFGGGLGGLLASINYKLLFWVDGGTNILAGLLLLVLIPRSGIIKQKNEHVGTVGHTSAYRDKVYLVFVLLGVLFNICFYEFIIMEPAFYKLDWHFGERLIGFLLALNGIIIAFVEMVMIHNIEGKRNGLFYICLGILLSVAGFILLNIVPPLAVIAILLVVLMTFSEMLSMPFMNTFWIARAQDHNRGEYAALYSMSWSAAQIVAPLIGGFVIAYGGFKLLWWVLAGLCLLSVCGFLMLYQQINSKQKQIAV